MKVEIQQSDHEVGARQLGRTDRNGGLWVKGYNSYHIVYIKIKLLLMLWVKNGSLCSGNTCWKWQTKLSHEATCLDSCQMRLLLSKGNSCNRPRRPGGRKCKYKSVQECIVDDSLSCLNLIVEHKREKGIPSLIDTTVNQHLGPKRANRIWKLFCLSKEDDAHQYFAGKP